MTNNGHDTTTLIEDRVVDAEAEEAAKGALIVLDGLKRGNDIYTPQQNNTSLLHKVISAILDDKDYRIELKTGNFKDSDEADDATAAIDECLALGMELRPVVDRVIARNSGINHQLLRDALEALTHTTFNTNYQKGGKNNDRSKSGSPIA
jgi:hypothetical protein